jgi:hypothetical protein
MSANNSHIRRYQYQFLEEPGKKQSTESAMLYLYGDHDTLLAMLLFHDIDEPTDPPRRHDSGVITAHCPRACLHDYVDMLRNEKPVYCCWSEETQKLVISSNMEPVGEQELRKLFSWLYL